jgi:tetratricopeptide (TPR) repeat protein
VRVVAAVLLLVVSAGCASAPRKRADIAASAAADALVRQGCYECLVEARFTYERLAVGKPRAAILPRLFEATALVALRERELAIDNGPTLARAKVLAAELPAEMGAAAALEIVELIPGHEAGWSKRRHSAFLKEHRLAPDDLAARRKPLEIGLLAPLFRQYLDTALRCSHWRWARELEDRRLPEVPPDAPPLLRFRFATCVGAFQKPLEALRTEVPRFVETALYLGRLELKNTPKDGGRKARALLLDAYKHFPTSTAVVFLTGSAYQAAGDRKTALRYFDEALALEEGHEDALLGRTVCLSHLGRHREAIAAATRIIELQTADFGDAYYWRAWNRHALKELTEARADIDVARRHRHSVGVLTLAGIIEHDQDDLDPAEKDLDTAVDMDARNCTAIWYQALVQIKRKAWARSAGHFASSTTCYDLDVKDDEKRLEEMRNATNVEEDFRAQQIAGFEAAIREDRAQASASAFNAATNYLRSRDFAKASAFADRASEDPERAAKVEELRKLIAERR